jgi:23S rRNA (pseudouridine1915-N3)-methyltransferase
MKSVLFDFRTAKEEWFETAAQQYSKKISNFTEFEIVNLKTIKQGRDEAELKKKFEASELVKRLNQDDFIILFDESGKNFASEEFSERITKIEDSGKKRIVYVIGGAYGVTDEIKVRAHLKLSLSSFIMNHLVAETVVLEQIYRAYTIKNRIPYHNA